MLKKKKSAPSTLGSKQSPVYLFSNSKDNFSSPQGTKSGPVLYKSKQDVDSICGAEIIHKQIESFISKIILFYTSQHQDHLRKR